MARVKKDGITIQDIAEKLKISTSTVSRALNNHPKISSSTIKKVHDVAKTLGYKPNVPVFFENKKQCKKLAIIVPELQNALYLEVIAKIQLEFEDYNCLVACSKGDVDLEKRLIEDFLEMGVSGFFISQADPGVIRHIQKIFTAQVPLVLFDNVNFDLHVQKIVVDYYQGAYKAVQHLVSLNCKKIALVVEDGNNVINEDYRKGYHSALDHLVGEEEEMKHVYCIYDSPIKKKQIFDLILHSDHAYDAVIFTNAIYLMQFIAQVKKNGISIPDDIRVVCNGIENVITLNDTSVTTINCDMNSFASILCKCMLRQFEYDEYLNNSLVVPSKIIIRSSSIII